MKNISTIESQYISGGTNAKQMAARLMMTMPKKRRYFKLSFRAKNPVRKLDIPYPRYTIESGMVTSATLENPKNAEICGYIGAKKISR